MNADKKKVKVQVKVSIPHSELRIPHFKTGIYIKPGSQVARPGKRQQMMTTAT
jgi:hypothetical protein